MITEDTLKQVLASQLSGSSEEQMQALLTTATNLAAVQPGTIDYIKLLSPVCMSSLHNYNTVQVASLNIKQLSGGRYI